MGEFRPPFSAAWLYSNPQLGSEALHILNGEKIHKDEICSSQCSLQRFASAKKSSVDQGHTAVNTLHSTTPVAPNLGRLLCLCLVPINMAVAYCFLLLIGGQTTSLGSLIFFNSRRKVCV